MKKNRLFVLVTILVFVSLACGLGAKGDSLAGKDPQQNAGQPSAPDGPGQNQNPANLPGLGESRRVEDGGFEFQVVPGYDLNVQGGMASMMAPGADPDTGPVLQLIGWKNESAKTNQDLYDELKRDTPMDISPSSAVQVAGLPGLAADITGDNNGKLMQGRAVMVMVNSTQQFVALMGAPQAEWATVAPWLDAVLASVKFFELASMPVTSGVGPGRYAYTNGNVVRDLVVYNGVVYAATLGGLVTWRLDSGYSMQYTPLDGMGHVSAASIAFCEIPEPRILVGTLSGISIYDPNTGLWEQKQLAPADSRVDMSKIDRLYCDQTNNRLLIGYNGLGVLDLGTGAFARYTKNEGLLWDGVTDITVNGKDIWIASGYEGVASISNGKVTAYGAANGIPDKVAYALDFAPDGTLWVGASSGLMSFKGGKWNLYGAESAAKLASINEIEIGTDGAIWAATAPLGIGRLCKFNPQTASCDVDIAEIDNQAILALTLDGDDAPIYGTSRGVYRMVNGIPQPYKTEDKLVSNYVDSLSLSPAGQLWVGTDMGIHTLDPANPEGTWQTFLQNDTPAMGGKWASSIAFAPDGTAWITFINGGAARYQNGAWTAFKDIYSYNVVAVDGQNRAWFGDDGKGVIVLNSDGSPALKLTTAEGLPGDNVQALVADESGAMWIGTDQGLARYADGALKVVYGKESTDLPNKYIRALALDQNGGLLIGAFTGVARYQDGQVETLLDFLKDGFSEARLTTLAVAPNGRIWVGTDKGILYSDDSATWKRLTTQDGLLTNYISALYVDPLGAAWIGGGGSNFDGGGLLHIVP